MIVWSGWGIAVVVVAAVAVIAVQSAVVAVYGQPYYAGHVWPKLVSWLLAAAAIWPVGRWLDSAPKRTFVDKDTGHEVVVGRRDSLFFIPVRYWVFILAAIAALISANDLSMGRPF
jgi:CDP-diglyceride synthetase